MNTPVGLLSAFVNIQLLGTLKLILAPFKSVSTKLIFILIYLYTLSTALTPDGCPSTFSTVTSAFATPFLNSNSNPLMPTSLLIPKLFLSPAFAWKFKTDLSVSVVVAAPPEAPPAPPEVPPPELEHDLEVSGLPVSVPQAFESVQVLVPQLFPESLQAPQPHTAIQIVKFQFSETPVLPTLSKQLISQL